MLSAWIAASIAVQATPPIDEWAGGIPSESTETVAWKCGGQTSMAEIRTVGLRSGRKPPYGFTTELVQLQVNGRAPSAETLRKVQAFLAPLYSVGKFLGRCASAQVPRLFVTGHVPTGNHQSEARNLYLELH